MNSFLTRFRFPAGALLVVSLLLLWALTDRVGQDAVTAAEPPAEATYVGTSKCAPCHFAQFQQWKQDSHARSFEILPEKYKTEAGCLKCHTTGFGTPSGYQDASTPSLAGTTCEACHGPGSDHVDVAQRMVDTELTEENQKQLRESIRRVQRDNACVHCHLNKAHKDPHPQFDKT